MVLKYKLNEKYSILTKTQDVAQTNPGQKIFTIYMKYNINKLEF